MARLVLAMVWCLCLASAWSVHADEETWGAQAAVVVQFDSAHYVVRRVAVPVAGFDGEELLLASGLEVNLERHGAGGMVCKIMDSGCDYPETTCFCAMPNWWHYQHWLDGAWRSSGVGAISWPISAGMIDGWVWGRTYDMLPIDPVTVFNEDAFSPAVPLIDYATEGLMVRLSGQGDRNGDAAVSCTYVLGGGTTEGQLPLLLQSDGSLLGWLPGPCPPGDYAVTLQIADPDGVNGSAQWRVEGSVPVVYAHDLFIPIAR